VDDGHANYTADAYPGPPEWKDLSDAASWGQGGGTFRGAPGRGIAGDATATGGVTMTMLLVLGALILYADKKVPR
jgi:hypothetical protein